MSEKLSDNVSVDDETATLTIYGIKYAGELFKALGQATPGKFEVVSNKDGVLTLRSMSGTEELP